MEIDENSNIHIPRFEGFAGVEKPLGAGYKPGEGNNPADSVFNRVLPNALTAKSDELFALARKSSLWTLSFGLASVSYTHLTLPTICSV